MTQRFSSRACIVTGAARGIGKAVAQRLLEEGGKVWLCDVRVELLEQTRGELESLGAVASSVVDVSRRADVERCVADCVGHFGSVDVLVNNAGIAHPAAFIDISDEQWDRTLNVNLRGTFYFSQIVARRMVAAGGGAIVNIASTNALRGQPGLAAYGASKAGIVNLTQTMALELGAAKIRVNAVCPGTIWTPLSEEAGLSQKTWDLLRRYTAVNRLGLPQDIAAAVAYLASDDAGFVTGHALVVDGGTTARQLLLDSDALTSPDSDSS